MKIKGTHDGFSLVELLIAMVISLVLIFACTSVYSSLQNSISVAQSLSHAQESLRTAHYLMSRSVRQAGGLQVLGTGANTELIVTYGAEANNNEFYGCLGELQTSGATDTFYVTNDYLYCQTETNLGVSSGNEIVALAVTSLDATLATSPHKGVQVTLAIEGMPGDMESNGFAFSLAMRQRILIDASVEGASDTGL